MSDQTLESLAATILEKVVVLSRQLGAESIPGPTFAESGHNDYEGESGSLRKTRYELASAAKSLWLLAQGPEDQIITLKWAPSDTANLDVLLRFDIPEAIPLDGVIASTDLAKKVDLPLDVTERMVRYAIGNGVFTEPYQGIFAHSAASSKLTRSTHLRKLAVGSCGLHARFVGRIADALMLQQGARQGVTKLLLESDEPVPVPEAPFNLAYPGNKNVFDLTTKNPRVAEVYHDAMVARANLPRWKMSHILNAKDWSDVGEATIVDVSVILFSPCRLAAYLLETSGKLKGEYFNLGWRVGRTDVSGNGTGLPKRQICRAGLQQGRVGTGPNDIGSGIPAVLRSYLVCSIRLLSGKYRAGRLLHLPAHPP